MPDSALVALLDRCQLVAGLLATVGELGFVDPQPARLSSDLERLRSLEPPYEIRVVVLDATPPGGCLLGDILALPDTERDGRRPVGSPRITRQRVWLPAGLSGVLPRLTLAPLVPDDCAPKPDIRAELVDAHAIVIVIGYRDVDADPGGRRAAQTIGRVKPWLPLLTDIAAPELLTVAVDGVEASNSHPDSRLSSTRRKVRTLLPLPTSWPSAGIIELSSRRTLDAVLAHRAAGAPVSHLVWAWDAHGVAGVIGRTFLPFGRDPVRWLTVSTLRRALATFSRADRELHDRLGSRPADDQVDPALALLPRYARQRQAWLVARGLAGSLATAQSEISAALQAIDRN